MMSKGVGSEVDRIVGSKLSKEVALFEGVVCRQECRFMCDCVGRKG
jgi:hypothetical protein